MIKYPAFAENIRKYIDLSEPEMFRFGSFYSVKEIAKNEIILSEGQVCEFEGYVLEGCFKIFYEDEDLREHILYFAVEDWWVLDIWSFASGKPSSLKIQALEDSRILYIDRAKKEKLYEEMPMVEKLFRLMNQKSLGAVQQRIISMLHKTSDKRYLDFKKRYPTLEQRIPQHQIAAYLGISHEFLSKVRKKIVKKKP